MCDLAPQITRIKKQRVESGPGLRVHPKDSRVGVGPARGIRGDYVVVTPHYLRGPSGPAISTPGLQAWLF